VPENHDSRLQPEDRDQAFGRSVRDEQSLAGQTEGPLQFGNCWLNAVHGNSKKAVKVKGGEIEAVPRPLVPVSPGGAIRINYFIMDLGNMTIPTAAGNGHVGFWAQGVNVGFEFHP
jgi:hypothetical protein